jgi:pilus assembly protein CpaF
VHINRDRDGVRRVTRVSSVDGMEGDLVTLSDVFVFEGEVGSDGSVAGSLRPTGVRPKLTERLHDAGITLPADVFGAEAA